MPTGHSFSACACVCVDELLHVLVKSGSGRKLCWRIFFLSFLVCVCLWLKLFPGSIATHESWCVWKKCFVKRNKILTKNGLRVEREKTSEVWRRGGGNSRCVFAWEAYRRVKVLVVACNACTNFLWSAGKIIYGRHLANSILVNQKSLHFENEAINFLNSRPNDHREGKDDFARFWTILINDQRKKKQIKTFGIQISRRSVQPFQETVYFYLSASR